MPRYFKFSQNDTPVCRLGLATRGNTHLDKESVLLALERGINYWNWCGHEDGMSRAIRELGTLRSGVLIAIHLNARSEHARLELEKSLRLLITDYLDAVTYYYVESSTEWEEIRGIHGCLEALKKAQQEGMVRMIGLTTHQRSIASQVLTTRLLDLLMVRYNAAHRSAEFTIFPEAQRLRIPLITFTALRWKALLKPTPEDPTEFFCPPAREWYRLALAHPAVAVTLTAPGNRKELLENLKLLEDWKPPSMAGFEALRGHGDPVRRTAGRFP